jgi:hypothetical protein
MPRSVMPPTAAAAAAAAAVERAARTDVLTSAVGAAICATFVSAAARTERPFVVPAAHVAGMAFNALAPPLLYLLARRWYLRRRVAVALAVRASFIWGTTAAYASLDGAHAARSWGSLLGLLAFESRAAIAAWGAFGWQLPFALQVAAQAAHVAAAAHLVPALCADAAAGGAATLLSLNRAKFRAAARALDAPFALVWAPAPRELAAATPDAATCAALVRWAQVVAGFLLPTALLAGAGTGGARVARWLGPRAPLAGALAAQGVW